MTSRSKAEEIARLERRLSSRIPLAGGLIRRQAVTALMENGSPEAVAVLARASVESADTTVRERARAFVSQLGDHRSVNVVCQVWYELRHPALDALLVQNNWVASHPVEVRVFSALKVGALGILQSAGPEVIGPLLMACDDFDPDIKVRFQEVVRNLQKPETRDALCAALIERDFPLARAIAVEMGIAPENLATRALFFFLTGQWDRYDALDFDQRMLRAAYEGANATVRQRIREQLRLTGRAEFLTVVIGQDFASRVAGMTPEEFEFVVGMLRAQQNWPRLWGMVFEAPLLWSARILEMLTSVGWQPAEEERELFARLWSLRAAGLLLDPDALIRGFPRAVLQAHLRAPGHINDVAFAPKRPLLAVGTGVRKVVLWNYQTARPESVLGGFEHSIGQVTFTKDGKLVCAERSNQTAALTGIYGWDGRELRKLGLHQGPVTALEALSGSTALSAGRDHDIALWDIASGQMLARHTLPDWPRVARPVPHARTALVLMQRQAYWLNLDDMTVIVRGRFNSSPSCVAFVSKDEAIIGRHNGWVSFFYRHNPHWLREGKQLSVHAACVQGIEVLPKSGYILTAGREGEVRFFDLVERVQVDRVLLQGVSLTTLHISPDESFMALGHTGATFSLWDLRGSSVVALLRAPLASASPVSLGLLDAFANNPKLEESARRTAAYAATIVRHRSRFDIELVVEAPSILAGEFDIEIE
ncbi:MAG: hypothetical protein JXA21_17025 [Anaerolineae bacterium]|nr:hypothetical protein [Anaerolineae bacterium]